MSEEHKSSPDDLRVEIHPAGQPWFTGPTEELRPFDWGRRAHTLIRRRVAGYRGVVARFDSDPAVTDLVLEVVERTHEAHPPRWTLVRWLDARETPVLLEAEAVPRRASGEAHARLGDLLPGEQLLVDETISAEEGRTIRRAAVVAPATAHTAEVRYLVDAGDPEGVTVVRAQVAADELERLTPELTAIASTARVRPGTAPVSRATRRSRRLRRVEAFPAAGIPVGIAALLGFALPYTVALTAPGGTNGVEAWTRALAVRPITETRTLVTWVLTALALSLFVTLRRDAHLVREVGDRDFGNYLALGALLIGVGAAIGAFPVVLVGFVLLGVTAMIRWHRPQDRGRRDRFQGALLVVLAVLLVRWFGLDGLRSAAHWELSLSASESQVNAWVDERLPSWADLATLDLITVVLLNIAALLPLAAYLRDRVDFDFGLGLAIGTLGLLALVAINGGWTAILTAVVLAPKLWRKGRAYDRARFSALREGRPAPGLYRGQQ